MSQQRYEYNSLDEFSRYKAFWTPQLDGPISKESIVFIFEPSAGFTQVKTFRYVDIKKDVREQNGRVVTRLFRDVTQKEREYIETSLAHFVRQVEIIYMDD